MSDDKTREAALADALQLVLDDWANANMIGDDARADAEQALNMLDTNETPESPKGEEALVAGQATNGASGDNPGRCGSVRTLADSKGSTCRQTESAAPDESNRHCQYAQDVGMPEYRCAVECRYMQSSTPRGTDDRVDDGLRGPEDIARSASGAVEALRECRAYFERELADDQTLIDGDFGTAYRLTVAALAAAESKARTE
jgi:hypothetical protein